VKEEAVRVQHHEGRYIVRLESGEEAISALTALLTAEGISFANISGAGALRRARLGYWNAARCAYEYRDVTDQVEVVSFQGNAALKDGAPFLHLHAVLSRHDFTVLGGHVKEAHVHPTLEVWLRTEQMPVRRTHDGAPGLDLLDLPERVEVRR
jgi:predicted DNA-binding protein with PD1-like motif